MPDTQPPSSPCSIPSIRQPETFVRFSGVLFTLVIILGEFTACASPQANRPAPLRCPTALKAMVSPTKPTVHVSYTEPSFNSTGAPLKTLAKTTIYYDFGDGRVPAQEVPASKPTGGGDITQTVTIPLTGQSEQAVFICVTATDTAGHESSTIP